MSVHIMVLLASILEGIAEFVIWAKNKIELAIETEKFKRSIRDRRSGYRADYKTRIKYKLESVIDNIITPN